MKVIFTIREMENKREKQEQTQVRKKQAYKNIKWFPYPPHVLLFGVLVLTTLPVLQSYLGFMFMQNTHNEAPFPWTTHIVYRLSDAVTWVLLLSFIHGFFKRNPLSEKSLKLVGKYALAAVVFCIIHKSVSMVLMMGILNFTEEVVNWPEWIDMGIKSLPREVAGRLPEFMLIGGILLATDFYRQNHEKRLELLKVNEQLAKARLRALRAQLHPHFLFNAMNSVASLMEEDIVLARKLLAKLADLLSVILDLEDKTYVQWGDELSLSESYLEIQRIRFGDKFTYEIDVNRSSAEVLVPTLILQPILENSIKHNLALGAVQLHVKITSEMENAHLKVVVEDFTEPTSQVSPAQNKGKGLHNVKARVETLYGNKGIFLTKAKPEGGYQVLFKFPLNT